MGGGWVNVLRGTYQLKNLAMTSNVHYRISAETTIQLPSNGSVFTATSGQKNWSIRSVGGGRFNVSLKDRDSSRVIFCSDTSNGLFSGVNIQDPDESIFSSVELTWNSSNNKIPTDLTIQNITQDKEEYGYGVMQSQAAQSCDFRNLKGRGGVPVRLETGWIRMLLAKQGGVFGVRATNITSERGQAAVYLFPHSRENGSVFLNFTTSVGSEFTVLNDGGSNFKVAADLGISRDQATNRGFAPGSFSRISVGNATGTYRARNVPTRFVHLRNYTRGELTNKVFRGSTVRGASYTGPSIAVYGDYGNPTGKESVWNLKKIGGYVHPARISRKFDHPGSIISNLPRL